MDFTCLSIYPPLPSVPKTANDSTTSVHPTYEPNSGGISQRISALMAHLTFSTNDIHSLLKKLFNRDVSSWNVSEIAGTSPIPSIIIYSSLALALFLIFSLIFCIISCRNSKKHQARKKRQSKTTQICVCLLIIVYLLGIGDMIYVAYRINQSKLSLDDTIKEINRDVYPKEISEHMKYLNNQLNTLDQYCIESNSILINASKSMVVKAFEGILKEKYLLQDIVQSVNNIDVHMKELSDAIDKEPTIPQTAIELFEDLQQRYQSMIVYIQIPVLEVCIYANGTQTDIDKKLLEALDVVHVELKKLIDTINQDILNKITPWQNNMLIDTDSEEQIRGYISLVGTIFFVLVIVLGGIPLIFFFFIIISRLCGCCQDTMSSGYSENDAYHRHKPRNKVVPANHYRQRSKSRNGVLLCLMRIAFAVMIILLVVTVLLTGIYYALDLAVQGGCRTAHDDQPFLINLISDKLIESNIIFGNSSEMNKIMMNVINDCRDQVHFSRKLVENYWSILDVDVKEMMNTLSKKIFDKFIKSIEDINIPSDFDLLIEFVSQANLSNISVIVQRIETDLTTMEGYFDKINSTNFTLPQSLVQTTIDEFKDYVKKVLEFTVDGCPLPLATVYKTDTLVCHTLGGSVGGLWLSVFFFMTLITVGLCIFGLCVYKRLN